MDRSNRKTSMTIDTKYLAFAGLQAFMGLVWVGTMGISTADVVFLAISMAMAGEHINAGYWNCMTTEERKQSETVRCVTRSFLTTFLFVVVSAIAERGGLFPTPGELESAFYATWFIAFVMGGYAYLGREAPNTTSPTPQLLEHVEVPRSLMLFYTIVISLFLKKNFPTPAVSVVCTSCIVLMAPDKAESELLFMASLWWLGFCVSE
eukprot:TRINITY_DN23315_c0_g1_i1.p1 TRINITY_DN23315_c0_g1~~TRINITY_DN23315_c0_g1_i1.p1  ORF type:complete len:232 (+),score=27.47 TRINITY_DN23315_c0_g1_i1:76-696(+)